MLIFGVWDWVLSYIKEGIVWVINLVIASLGALFSSILALLPNMPSFPDFSFLPSGVVTFFAWGGYYFPIGYLLTLMTTIILLWFAWRVLAIPLRWVKAIPGDQ